MALHSGEASVKGLFARNESRHSRQGGLFNRRVTG